MFLAGPEIRNVSPWPWPWPWRVLKDSAEILGLGLDLEAEVLGLGLGNEGQVLGLGLGFGLVLGLEISRPRTISRTYKM